MSNPIVTIIPAAGASRRYQEAGFAIHKPYLEVAYNGKVQQMVSHVIDSAPYGSKIIGIPWKRDYPKDIRANYMSIRNTRGQAETILQMIQGLPGDLAVLVLDCDMVLTQFDISAITALCVNGNFDCVVAVAKTFDPNASRVDRIPHPTRFVEKEPISEWGIVGARAFNRVANLITALELTIEECEHLRIEPYISMAMNYYPGTKYAHIITEYQDWGTPERLKQSGAEIVNT